MCVHVHDMVHVDGRLRRVARTALASIIASVILSSGMLGALEIKIRIRVNCTPGIGLRLWGVREKAKR